MTASRYPLPMLEHTRTAQRLATKEIIAEGRTHAKLVELGANVKTFTDMTIEVVGERHPPDRPVACGGGCHWCCSMAVEVSAPEVFHLAAVVGPDTVVRLDEQSGRWEAGENAYCALLDRGRCSVYYVRPVVCRAYWSYDASQCEMAYTRGRGDTPSVWGGSRMAAADVSEGMLSGTHTADLLTRGTKAERLELSRALRVALTVPDAAERYLRSEDVFAAARFRPERII